MIIEHLFPNPVYFSKLERALTKEELKTINEYKKKTYKNAGNTTSSDTYVLENKTLKNLKKDLNKMVIDYFNKIVCTDNSIVPYITQSWLNYTKNKQFHHTHSHANSYVSGVFYINADKKVDKIKFYKDNNSLFKLKTTKFNIFNSDSWWYSIKTGDVILFPSSLRHGVNKKEGKNIRISLSFNVFLKGTIGDKHELTELVI
jgi:uncharacterized protein (TIGR02466 family)|tara:strand:+ start:142 stop:747 length:606 start_codon:yes stop_codon:yes gene_type:complete